MQSKLLLQTIYSTYREGVVLFNKEERMFEQSTSFNTWMEMDCYTDIGWTKH